MALLNLSSFRLTTACLKELWNCPEVVSGAGVFVDTYHSVQQEGMVAVTN